MLKEFQQQILDFTKTELKVQIGVFIFFFFWMIYGSSQEAFMGGVAELIYYYIAFNLLAFLGSANYCAFFWTYPDREVTDNNTLNFKNFKIRLFLLSSIVVAFILVGSFIFRFLPQELTGIGLLFSFPLPLLMLIYLIAQIIFLQRQLNKSDPSE